MVKRSRKVSTKRHRRSKSGSRKTMKRTKKTKQQTSRKHTLKKRTLKKQTLKKRTLKKRTLKKRTLKKRTLKKRTLKKAKSRTKSVHKRIHKRTKKIIKGGAIVEKNQLNQLLIPYLYTDVDIELLKTAFNELTNISTDNQNIIYISKTSSTITPIDFNEFVGSNYKISYIDNNSTEVGTTLMTIYMFCSDTNFVYLYLLPDDKRGIISDNPLEWKQVALPADALFEDFNSFKTTLIDILKDKYNGGQYMDLYEKTNYNYIALSEFINTYGNILLAKRSSLKPVTNQPHPLQNVPPPRMTKPVTEQSKNMGVTPASDESASDEFAYLLPVTIQHTKGNIYDTPQNTVVA